MNPILFLVLAAGLIAVAFYLVAAPILWHGRRASAPPSVSSEQERLADLLANRDGAFQALRELSFDHRVGKITDADFSAFEVHLKRTAAETLRALDEWEHQADEDLDLVLERAVLHRKARIQAAHRPAGAADGKVCSKCGRSASTSDRFCGGCGAPLSELAPVPQSLSCPNCGRAYKASDNFCAGCGNVLSVQSVSRVAG